MATLRSPVPGIVRVFDVSFALKVTGVPSRDQVTFATFASVTVSLAAPAGSLMTGAVGVARAVGGVGASVVR